MQPDVSSLHYGNDSSRVSPREKFAFRLSSQLLFSMSARAADIIPFALLKRRDQPEVEKLRYPALLDSFDVARETESRESRIHRHTYDDDEVVWRLPRRVSLSFPDSAADRNIKTQEIRSFNIEILGIALYSPNNPSPAGRPSERESTLGEFNSRLFDEHDSGAAWLARNKAPASPLPIIIIDAMLLARVCDE